MRKPVRVQDFTQPNCSVLQKIARDFNTISDHKYLSSIGSIQTAHVCMTICDFC